MKPPCPRCGHTHTTADTAAVRRFDNLTHRFVAMFPGAPERVTRAKAERDMCDHRQETGR